MAYSTRIIEVANLVTKKRVADIGCDHGYLITYLLENKIVDFAIGSDLNELPLLNAKKNVMAKNLTNKVEFYISNGLEKIQKEDFDCVVVAGMGGSLIATILEQALDKISNKEIIVQPNNNSKTLRTLMQKNGFKVECEKIICEKHVIYEILKFVPGVQNWNDFELEFGKYNLELKSDLFIKLYQEKLDVLQSHFKNVTNPSNELKLQEKINRIKKAIT